VRFWGFLGLVGVSLDTLTGKTGIRDKETVGGTFEQGMKKTGAAEIQYADMSSNRKKTNKKNSKITRKSKSDHQNKKSTQTRRRQIEVGRLVGQKTQWPPENDA